MTTSVALAAGMLVAALGYVALAAYVWRHREAADAPALAAVLLSVGVWTVCYGFELASTSLPVAKFWSGLKYVGIVLLAPSLWAFVLSYTGTPSPRARRLLALLLVQPVAVLLVLVVPAAHDLLHYYPIDDPAADKAQRYVGSSLLPESGPLFWPHAFYTYAVLAAAVGLLVVRLAKLSRPYRRQGVVMMVACFLPLVGNVAFNSGVAGAGLVDPTPFLFSVMAVVLVWGFFRLRLLGLVRVARTVVVDRMPDAVLVTDMYGRIADVNPAAERRLGTSRTRLVGVALTSRLPELTDLLARHEDGHTTSAEVELGEFGEGTDVEAQVTSLVDGGRESGVVVVLHDITERRRTQRKVLELLTEQTRLAETLQQSLRPATLPDVPNLQLAARSEPAGEDGRLSGDFYDVHQAGENRWAFVLGDVSGKGVHAAVVTSMARHTVRTLSAQQLSPAQVLRQLNHALLSDDVERFCTVVYGALTPCPSGVGVTLALGGHPAPLLRVCDGSVAPCGVPGTALGVVPQVQVHEVTTTLRPGEALLLYTDGVTEARAPAGPGGLPGEQFGEDRLARALADGGPTAESIAGHVLTCVDSYADHRDDVALLALVAR